MSASAAQPWPTGPTIAASSSPHYADNSFFWWNSCNTKPSHQLEWLTLFGNLPVLRRWKAAGWEGAGETALSKTYPLELADVVFNPSFPWGSVNQKYIRDEDQHISFVLGNKSSWREMCGYNLHLMALCQFYSPERCIHKNLVKSLPPPSHPPFPDRQGIKVFATKYQKTFY